MIWSYKSLNLSKLSLYPPKPLYSFTSKCSYVIKVIENKFISLDVYSNPNFIHNWTSHHPAYTKKAIGNCLYLRKRNIGTKGRWLGDSTTLLQDNTFQYFPLLNQVAYSKSTTLHCFPIKKNYFRGGIYLPYLLLGKISLPIAMFVKWEEKDFKENSPFSLNFQISSSKASCSLIIIWEKPKKTDIFIHLPIIEDSDKVHSQNPVANAKKRLYHHDLLQQGKEYSMKKCYFWDLLHSRHPFKASLFNPTLLSI